MALSEDFYIALKAAVIRRIEHTTYAAAAAAFHDRSDFDIGPSIQLWNAAWGDAQAGGSPALALRRAIRECVAAAADADASVSPLDRESAFREMCTRLIYTPPKPNAERRAAEMAELDELIMRDRG